MVGGLQEHEYNVLSGHAYVGLEFSHNALDNTAIGNYFGTRLDGRTGASWTRNGRAVIIKDDARSTAWRRRSTHRGS